MTCSHVNSIAFFSLSACSALVIEANTSEEVLSGVLGRNKPEVVICVFHLSSAHCLVS